MARPASPTGSVHSFLDEDPYPSGPSTRRAHPQHPTPPRPSSSISNLASPDLTPTSLLDRLESHLRAKAEEVQLAGQLGQALLAQQQELEARIREIAEVSNRYAASIAASSGGNGDSSSDEREVGEETKKSLRMLEEELARWEGANSELYQVVGTAAARGIPAAAEVEQDDAIHRPRAPSLSRKSSLADLTNSSSSQSLADYTQAATAAAGGSGSNSHSRRARNAAAQHRSNDIELATEIGQSLLVEVRRLQALLQERDEHLKALEKERDEKDLEVENAMQARRAVEDDVEKYKEINWELELASQDLRTALSTANSSLQKADQERARHAKDLATTRDQLDSQRLESERLAKDLAELKNKHETDMANMRKSQAGLQRDKSDLQGTLEGLKNEIATRNRAIRRGPGGSPAPGTPGYRGAGQDDEDEAGDGFGEDVFRSTARRRTGEGFPSSAIGKDDLFGPGEGDSPSASPIQRAGFATEADSLRASLAHAQRQVQTLRTSLQREKQAKLDLKRQLAGGPAGKDGRGGKVWGDDPLDGSDSEEEDADLDLVGGGALDQGASFVTESEHEVDEHDFLSAPHSKPSRTPARGQLGSPAWPRSARGSARGRRGGSRQQSRVPSRLARAFGSPDLASSEEENTSSASPTARAAETAEVDDVSTDGASIFEHQFLGAPGSGIAVTDGEDSFDNGDSPLRDRRGVSVETEDSLLGPGETLADAFGGADRSRGHGRTGSLGSLASFLADRKRLSRSESVATVAEADEAALTRSATLRAVEWTDRATSTDFEPEVRIERVEVPVPFEVVREVERRVEVPVDRIVEVEKFVEVEKRVEVPVDRIVEVEKLVEVEKRVEVPVDRIVEVEKRVEVPVDRIVEVEKLVEVEKRVEVPVERIVEVQVDRIVEVEKRVEVPVDRIVEVEKLVEVEKRVEVPVERIVEVERRVEVPIEVVRTVEIEKRVEVPVDVERRVEVPVEKVVERIVEVPVEVIKTVEVEVIKTIEVPVDRVVDRIVEKPVDVVREVERLVEVPVDRIVEKIVERHVEVPVEIVKEVEKRIEVPVEVIKEVMVEVEKRVEVPVDRIVEVEKRVEVPVDRIVEVEKLVEVPVDRIVEVEKRVEVPVDRIVEVEKRVEVPVDRIVEVEKRVEVPVDRIVEVEKLVEVPIDRIVEVEKLVEVPVDRIVEVEKRVEVPVDRIVEVEKRVEVPVDRIVEVEKRVEVPVEVIRVVDRVVERLVHAPSEPCETCAALATGPPTPVPGSTARMEDRALANQPSLSELTAPGAPRDREQTISSFAALQGLRSTPDEDSEDDARSDTTGRGPPSRQTYYTDAETEYEDARESLGGATSSLGGRSANGPRPSYPDSMLTRSTSANDFVSVRSGRTTAFGDESDSEAEILASREYEVDEEETRAFRHTLRNNAAEWQAANAAQQSVANEPEARTVYVDKIVYVDKPIEVEKVVYVDRIVEVEKQVEVPVDRIVEVEKVVEKIVERTVYVDRPAPTPASAASGARALKDGDDLQEALQTASAYLAGPASRPITPSPSVRDLRSDQKELMGPPPVPSSRKIASPRKSGTSAASARSAQRQPPSRPTSPPPADLLFRAQSPTFDDEYSRRSTLLVPPVPAVSSAPKLRSRGSAISATTSTRSDAPFADLGSARPHTSLGLTATPRSTRRSRQQPSRSSSRSMSDVSSRRASVASEATSDGGYDAPNGPPQSMGRPAGDSTDPEVIHAITQTMIGEFLHKYTRRNFSKELSEKRHQRFFWLHPYTRTLYWSTSDPGASSTSHAYSKSAYIEGVRQEHDANPLPPGLYQHSIVIRTREREVKFTASSKERHDMWYKAIKYLIERPEGSSGPADASADVGNSPKTPIARTAASRSRSRTLAGAEGPGDFFGIPDQIYTFGAASASDSRLTPKALPRWVPHGRNTVSGASTKRAGTAAADYQSHAGSISLRSLSTYGEFGESSLEVVDREEIPAEHASHADDEYEGLENVRACCNGKHDVGSLSRRNKHSHHRHQHSSHSDVEARSSTSLPTTPGRSRGKSGSNPLGSLSRKMSGIATPRKSFSGSSKSASDGGAVPARPFSALPVNGPLNRI